MAWMSAQGFGDWKPESRDDVETMRKVMEHAALHQNSKTRKCEKDCLHLILSWRTGETPSRAEMEQAAGEALGVLGMGKARAIFVAHDDKDHAHLHIVASRINPETGMVFRDSFSKLKWQKWAHEWELRHGLIQCPARDKRSQLEAAIDDRNAAAVLDAITQQKATFTGAELDRALARYIDDAGEAAALRAEILAQADLVELYDRKSGEALDRFTTRGVRDSEAKALAHAAALAANQHHGVSAAAKAAALAKCPTMREE
ncbi:MAG: relaxase/mobilization nuclease domain-containing protein, partial [Alphaproteobacteria bacterium]|nr:relaxase/mobilization nuclease domain-containing protein [Alphaproteobacteria bacterium]